MDGKIKKDLLLECARVLNLKLEDARTALAIAEEALLSDTKSSAGDKFETGREMAQQEISRSKKMFFEVEQQLFQLEKLKSMVSANEVVQLGSLVYTNLGVFFLGIGLGQIVVADTSCMVISAQSPIGKVFVGKTKSSQFSFMGKTYEILAIF